MSSIVALVAASILVSCSTKPRTPALALPGLMLWAWERPEDLRFVDRQTTGIAFLAATAFIAANGSPNFRLRTQALSLPPEAAVLAVVRIESAARHVAPDMSPWLTEFKRIANLPGVRGVQIDFDARSSERAFYRKLLASLRKELAKPIGVTALASWCAGDRWLDREPIAEAVPMFFRMGRGESRDMSLRSSVCLSSIGLSTDESWPIRRPAGVKRIFLFNPRAWTSADYARVLKRIEDWK